MLKKNAAVCQDLKLKMTASEELEVWGTHTHTMQVVQGTATHQRQPNTSIRN